MKSPFVAVFVPPKSKTTHNLSDLSSLYIAAKAAEKVALDHVTSAKSTDVVAVVATTA